MTKSWAVVRVKKDAHCVPVGDLRPHKKSRHCWCDPWFQDENEDPAIISDRMPLVVVHRPLDGQDKR